MTKRFMSIDLVPKVTQVLHNLGIYHERYYDVKTFGGPSLHFHRRALGLAGRGPTSAQTELIYAVLVAWGMHRMGKSGPKMVSFDVFEKSVLAVSPCLAKGKKINPLAMCDSDWALLEGIFKSVQVMKSKTRIVGNSKVMAHLLPNAIAPVDREYTLKFLFGNKNITNNLDHEWLLLRKIHEEFFYPIAQDAAFRKRAAKWMADQAQWPWDTSLLKVIDNLVIGAKKKKSAKKSKK